MTSNVMAMVAKLSALIAAHVSKAIWAMFVSIRVPKKQRSAQSNDGKPDFNSIRGIKCIFQLRMSNAIVAGDL